MNTPLLARYRELIAGVLTCYDRIVIAGTPPRQARTAEALPIAKTALHDKIRKYGLQGD